MSVMVAGPKPLNPNWPRTLHTHSPPIITCQAKHHIRAGTLVATLMANQSRHHGSSRLLNGSAQMTISMALIFIISPFGGSRMRSLKGCGMPQGAIQYKATSSNL